MSTTVVLVAYHGDRWLPNCLRSLPQASSETLHLVLVDNSGNSSIESLDLSPFRSEVLTTPHPMGFAEAHNFALLRASHLNDTVLFLNQDTVNGEKWLSNCVACLRSNPNMGALAPLTATYDWNGWDQNFIDAAVKSNAFRRDFNSGAFLKMVYEVPAIPAAAMVIRTDLLKAVGPFDPIYGSYYEDYDLCRRINVAGYKVGIFTRGQVAHHSGSATTTKSAEDRRARWITRNSVIYQLRGAEKHRTGLLLKYFLLTFPRNFIRSLLRRPAAKPLLPFILANWDLWTLMPRLVSSNRDQMQWEQYLKSVGWPPSS